MASSDVAKNLRKEHDKPEDLHGSNNNLTPLTHTEDTTSSATVGTKKGTKPTGKKKKKVIRIHREMVITNHEDVLKIFLPFVAFGGSVLLFAQSLIAIYLTGTQFIYY
ncbi:hypothetical protein B9Z55_002187 [Caenorhabditis nigoni]|uniref:Uncharacterized protein n=1 Tax=Caenorhabditis nigoni TaxID=1611254 RepID=A0A2G5VJ55_9PELO|nr:hypothetical protein B9Z55_002187 [Caenorhabditis nigoni]